LAEKKLAVYSVADPDHPVLFLTPGSGSAMGKNLDPDTGSGMNIPDNYSENVETVFWVKNT
jgi:hypothetical protein